jgi:hypothetical protein
MTPTLAEFSEEVKSISDEVGSCLTQQRDE